jgi:hypothetical protein
MAHWERRIQQIKRRLEEIAEANEWLHSFISQAEASEPRGREAEEQNSRGAEERRSTSTPLPSHSPARSDLYEITLRY